MCCFLKASWFPGEFSFTHAVYWSVIKDMWEFSVKCRGFYCLHVIQKSLQWKSCSLDSVLQTVCSGSGFDKHVHKITGSTALHIFSYGVLFCHIIILLRHISHACKISDLHSRKHSGKYPHKEVKVVCISQRCKWIIEQTKRCLLV